MKKLFLFLGAIAMICCLHVSVHAQLILSNTPRTLSYQGYLADAAKKPLSGIHNISITLYDASVEGNSLHTEKFSTQLDNGIFSIIIGSNAQLESSLRFDKPYWIGVSIDGSAELYPRTALSSVPYAIHAESANALLKGASGAVTTLNGKSGDIAIKGGDGTIVQSDGNTITITAVPTAAIGDNQTQATTVNSITGTNNQVIANGTTGTKQSGDVTLTLPQNINAGASPTFNNLTLSSMGNAGVVHNNGSGNLSSSLITNADVAGNANISGSKLNLNNTITSGDIVAGTIMNSDINAGANIAGSKLNLNNTITSGDIVAGTIMNSDINAGANIAASKLNLNNAITSGDIASGTIVNSDINATANIAYSKLNLAGNIINSDIAGGANISYNKLNLTGNITNADIANGANISPSKINLANAITSGDIAAGTIMNSDINAGANIAYGKLNLTGGIVNADIAGGAGISDTKLATITAGGKVSNSATTATSSNTNNAIVSRDGSGNFSAGTISASLNGNATNVTGTVQEAHGGTGLTTYTKGDILYASSANTISKRAIGNTGQVLTISNNGVPVWSALSGVGVTSMTGTANQVLVNGGSGIQTTGGITLTLPQDIHSGASPTFTGLTLSGKGVSASTADLDPPTTLVTKDYVDNIAVEYWSISGNSGLTPSNYIGTNDAEDLSFRTNAIEGLRLTTGGSLLLNGSTGSVPVNGAGTRMMWIPTLGAIRAGQATGTEWDAINIGQQSVGMGLGVDAIGAQSVAMGYMTTATDAGSVAMGYGTTASGVGSVALGDGTQTTGMGATAMGFSTQALGDGSTAMGSGTLANVSGATAFGSAAQAIGYNSVAMGENTTSTGNASVALGSNTTTNGLYSFAVGSNSTANGDYSVAMGNHATAGDNSAALGKDITVGTSTFAFNVGNSFTMDLTNLTGVVYFGNADVIIGNDDMSPRALKFYGANNDGNLLGAHFTSFTAGSQTADIAYTLPASQGAANSLMTNDGTGALSWSSLSSLNVPTGSGTANRVALWSSSSALGSASNLYYNSGNLGIGVTSPGDAFDVSGNANISGTITSGSGITTNGITMSGGATVLSYSNVSIANNGSITIPNVSVVNIQDDGINNTNSVSMPTGTNGQIIYIYNNDAQTTSGDITLSSGAMGVYVYIGGWKKAN